MFRGLLSFAIFLAASVAVCQNPNKLEFEVVAVRPSAPPDPRGMVVGCHGGPGTDDPTLLVCQNWDLVNLVAIAYGVDFYRLSAPDWMNGARYDVRAKVPAGATKEELGPMWQNMLAERFKLVTHRETRESQTYELIVAKGGPKFNAAGAPASTKKSGENVSQSSLDKIGYPSFGPGHPGMGMNRGLARLYYPHQSMAWLASLLSGQLGKPVIDATALKGEFELAMYWASDRLADASPDIGPTLGEALQDELGLRLESRKASVEFIVIDHAERVPSDN